MKKSRWLYLSVFLIGSFFTGCTPGTRDNTTVGSGPGHLEYIAQGENTGEYWPTAGWRTSRPEAMGMDSQKLAEAIAYAATPEFNTEGVLVVKNGYIVAEAYLDGFEIDETHVSNSMAKSFTSSLIGIAIDKGLISGIDEKLCRYYQEWDCSDENDLRRKITIRHALTLTSGLEWQENWAVWDPATNDALKMGASGQFMRYMSKRKGLNEPGQKFMYSTGDPMLLTRVIQEATGMSAFEFAKANLFAPLNIANVSWDEDRDGYTATAWGLYTTVREFAKFGYLFLNKGSWEDRQLVSEQWVEKSTKTDPSVAMWSAYGYLWHVNLPHRLSWSKSPIPTDAIPADGYMAAGVLGQNIFIIPSKNLVIVKVADQQGPQLDLVKFLTLIIEAEKPSGQ